MRKDGDDVPLTLPQRLAIGLVRGYQFALSPFLGGSCRFVPSCSAYAMTALQQFGVLKGSWLAIRRLSRCRPFAPHGFDPVPAAETGSPRHGGASLAPQD